MLEELKYYAGKLIEMDKKETDLSKDPNEFPTEEGRTAGKMVKEEIEKIENKRTIN